jgi:ABC-2 type transport system permease protein
MYFLINYLIRLWHRRRQTSVATVKDSSSSHASPARLVQADTGVAAAAVTATTTVTNVDTGPSAAARGAFFLLVHQVRNDLRTSLRNPRARFFTFFFPVLLLVVFSGVFGNGHTTVDGVRITLSVFYLPGILAMSIVVASYANLVISISALRETGVLKRRRATPVPPALLIAGQALSTVAITTVMSAILLVVAKVFYGVGMAPAAILAVACTALVGTVTFACIAYAVSGLIGSPESAQPIVQMTMLPLWFISGVFIPTSNLSGTVRSIGELFPVEHLASSLHLASVNSSFTGAISGTDLLVLAAWGAAAVAFASWRFSWLPSAASA